MWRGSVGSGRSWSEGTGEWKKIDGFWHPPSSTDCFWAHYWERVRGRSWWNSSKGFERPVKTREGRGRCPFLPFLVAPALFLSSKNWKGWEHPEATAWGCEAGGATMRLQTAAVDKIRKKMREDVMRGSIEAPFCLFPIVVLGHYGGKEMGVSF